MNKEHKEEFLEHLFLLKQKKKEWQALLLMVAIAVSSIFVKHTLKHLENVRVKNNQNVALVIVRY